MSFLTVDKQCGCGFTLKSAVFLQFKRLLNMSLLARLFVVTVLPFMAGPCLSEMTIIIIIF